MRNKGETFERSKTASLHSRCIISDGAVVRNILEKCRLGKKQWTKKREKKEERKEKLVKNPGDKKSTIY